MKTECFPAGGRRRNVWRSIVPLLAAVSMLMLSNIRLVQAQKKFSTAQKQQIDAHFNDLLRVFNNLLRRIGNTDAAMDLTNTNLFPRAARISLAQFFSSISNMTTIPTQTFVFQQLDTTTNKVVTTPIDALGTSIKNVTSSTFSVTDGETLIFDTKWLQSVPTAGIGAQQNQYYDALVSYYYYNNAFNTLKTEMQTVDQTNPSSMLKFFVDASAPETNYYRILYNNALYTQQQRSDALQDLLRVTDNTMSQLYNHEITLSSQPNAVWNSLANHPLFHDASGANVLLDNDFVTRITTGFYLPLLEPLTSRSAMLQNFVTIHTPRTAQVNGQTIIFVFGALLIGGLMKFFIRVFSDWTGIEIPYTVIMLLLGGLFGLIVVFDGPDYGNTNYLDGYSDLPHADPTVILLMFLPILLFESAYAVETHLFYKLATQIIVLGFVGLFISAVLTGFVAYELFSSGDETNQQQWQPSQIDYLFAFLVGDIFSATDPVTIIALLREVGAAKTLSLLIEGESIFNNGAAIIGYKIVIQIIRNLQNGASTSDILSQTAALAATIIIGSPIYGIVAGFCMVLVLSYIFNLWQAELMVVLCVPYLVFYTAESYFNMSGVIAVVVLGIVMSGHRTAITQEVEATVHRTCEILAFSANTLIFVIVGVLIAEQALTRGVITEMTCFDLLTFYVMINAIRPIMFFLLRPFLVRLGLKLKVMTLKNIMVSSWVGLRGAVAMALSLQIAQDPDISDRYGEAAGQAVLFNVAGIVLLTLFINATTTKWVLNKLGMLKLSHAKIIAINAAMKDLTATRTRIMDALKRDRLLADADWARVSEETFIEVPYSITEEDESWAYAHSIRKQDCDNCGELIEVRPRQREEHEMKDVARRRLLKALKESFWKQYEEGLLSAYGVKELNGMTDEAEDKDDGLIESSLVLAHLRSAKWEAIKTLVKSSNQKSAENNEYNKRGAARRGGGRRGRTAGGRVPPPTTMRRLRMPLYRLAYWSHFNTIMYVIIFLNFVEMVTSLIMQFSDSDSTTEVTKPRDWVFFGTSIFFCVVYQLEFFVKVLGLGWRDYWGSSWMRWNRIDFFLLFFSYFDVSVHVYTIFFAQNQGGSDLTSVRTIRLLKILRGVRLVRLSRLMRFLKPVTPAILRLLDAQVNKNLSTGYDIGKAYVVAHEETVRLVPTVMDYPPHIQLFREACDRARIQLIKALGLLQEERPDIAVAVKTRQSIRHVHNQTRKRVRELKQEGVIDDEEAQRFEEVLDIKVKRLANFPHSLPIQTAWQLLRNMPWLQGCREEVYEFFEAHVDEREFTKGSIICTPNEKYDGIMIITAGVVRLNFTKLAANREVDDDDDEDVNNNHADCMLYDISEDHTEEYIPRGNALNESGVLFDVPRNSSVTAASERVQLFHISRGSVRKALLKFPEFESRLFHYCAVATALRILVGLPSFAGFTLEQLRAQLTFSHVRMIRPLAEVTGLNVFSMVFIIRGRIEDPLTRRVFFAPTILPSSVGQLITLPDDIDTYDMDTGEQKQQRTGDGSKKPDWANYTILFLVAEEETDTPELMYDDDLIAPLQQVFPATEIQQRASASVLPTMNSNGNFGGQSSSRLFNNNNNNLAQPQQRMSSRRVSNSSMMARRSIGGISAGYGAPESGADTATLTGHMAHARQNHWQRERLKDEVKTVDIFELDVDTKKSSMMNLRSSLDSKTRLFTMPPPLQTPPASAVESDANTSLQSGAPSTNHPSLMMSNSLSVTGAHREHNQSSLLSLNRQPSELPLTARQRAAGGLQASMALPHPQQRASSSSFMSHNNKLELDLPGSVSNRTSSQKWSDRKER